jgi:L-asparaginase II
MRFARVRSGLAETHHDVACIAVDPDGAVLFASGDVDRPLFYRSAVKPFQALAGMRVGLQLPDEHLALACASHGGHPVHLAIVEQILHDHGLSEHDLRIQPDMPLSNTARQLQCEAGRRTPRALFHNCSGKHAGWLAACTLAGWDTTTYLDPSHPLQRSVVDIVADVTGVDPGPLGIDGCGAPTLRGTVAGLARGFSRLTTDRELEPIASAMTRFGALVADNVRADGRIGVDWGGPSKVGAAGLIGLCRQGIGIAARSIDGDDAVAAAAALEVADRLGMLPRGSAEWLTRVRNPPVLGGGLPVGALELVEV